MKRMSVLVLAALPALLGCQDDSFAVVSVRLFSGTLDGIAQFRVYVGNQGEQERLFYPKQPSESLHLDTNHPVTFSVEFSTSREGEAIFEVAPLDKSLSGLGYGISSVAISKGKVATVQVVVYAGAVRPERGLDGGTASEACAYGTASCQTCAVAVSSSAAAVMGIIPVLNSTAAFFSNSQHDGTWNTVVEPSASNWTTDYNGSNPVNQLPGASTTEVVALRNAITDLTATFGSRYPGGRFV